MHSLWGIAILGNKQGYIRIEYRRVGTDWPTHFDCDWSFVQPLSSFIQQYHTLNKVHYFADRDIFKVIWFHKLTTQVLVS